MVHYCMVWDKHIMDIKLDGSVICRISVSWECNAEW